MNIESLELLKLYDALEKAIHSRQLEIMYPYQESDENIGGGKGNTIDRSVETMAIAIAEDKELMDMVYIKSIVDRGLLAVKHLDGVDVLESLLRYLDRELVRVR